MKLFLPVGQNRTSLQENLIPCLLHLPFNAPKKLLWLKKKLLWLKNYLDSNKNSGKLWPSCFSCFQSVQLSWHRWFRPWGPAGKPPWLKVSNSVCNSGRCPWQQILAMEMMISELGKTKRANGSIISSLGCFGAKTFLAESSCVKQRVEEV